MKKIDLKKWLFNYLFYGYFLSLLILNFYSYISYDEFSFSFKILKGNFIIALIIMPLSMGFKNLFFEYKDIWKNSKVSKKIFIVLGLIFVIYGVYYRAKISGSF
ncbi:hypothetical protein H3N56_10250 [Cetobacterium sp. 2A]|uniref:hypothetical protein n=1 Tax=Cetobacterium sp. 2A TaxID=2754723 RepID=UPI00163C09A4|nr:hypothetical protein [Cetobacterium sp. 2A]MBC2856821.1 hypothetical protein [Cetobacterium sp. 2A]